MWANTFFGSAERERLEQAIDETWSDIDDQIRQSNGKALQNAWAQSAVRNLLDAEQKLVSGKLEQGWISTLSAQRAILANSDNKKRVVRRNCVTPRGRRQDHRVARKSDLRFNLREGRPPLRSHG
jgi:hypothetical protein